MTPLRGGAAPCTHTCTSARGGEWGSQPRLALLVSPRDTQHSRGAVLHHPQAPGHSCGAELPALPPMGHLQEPPHPVPGMPGPPPLPFPEEPRALPAA